MAAIRIFSILFLSAWLFHSGANAQNSKSLNEKTAALQTGKLTGRILDTKDKPVPYATVTLLHTDSSVVNGDLTREDGGFAISPTGLGDFILRINAIGFNVRFVDHIRISQDAPEKGLGKLNLTMNSRVLSEVQVTGEKSMMEMSVDKKVFNVEKDLTTTGGSATDVLKNVPSLAVDVDGDILLRGKETTLLIDGKPATLLGGDVTSALQSLPASSIQSVEVITNPSARFDAQGMAGIINIITKKDSKFGLNGSVSAGVGTGNKYNGALNLNLRNNKWNLFLNSSLKVNRNYQRNNSITHLDNGILIARSDEDNTRKFGGFFNTLGADYTIDANNTITFTQNINKMQWGGDGTTLSRSFNTSGIFIEGVQRSNDHSGGPLSSSSSLDFKHKFKKPKQELTSNVTFAKTWVEREQSYTTQDFTDGTDGTISLSGPKTIQNAPGGGSTASLNAQVDFTSPFLTRTGKLDAGVKTQLTWFESSNNATINGDQPDYSLQNNYSYDQQVHAAYANFNDQKGKLTYQAGLRLEDARYEGQGQNDSSYSSNFLSLFPSAYLSYKLSKQQDVYLSYTRRTNRPGFFQLMPYVDVSNPQDTSKGNPNLIPEFIHNTELSYSRQFEKGHQLILSGYYQYTQNLIERVKRVYADGTSFSKPENLASGSTFGAELTAKTVILPIWDVTVNLNVFNNQIHTGPISGLEDNSGSSFFAKLSSNLRLPYGLSLQANGGYDAPKVSAQGTTQEVWYMDMAVRKNLWNNKANVVLNVSDLFNTRKYTTDYDFAGYSQSTYKDRETRVANITFTYRFGRSDAKSSKRKQQTGQAPVKDRDNLKQGDDDPGGF